MLGETDLRLWPRPRSELRARLRNLLSPPISLGEARIRRKRSLELRLRLAWGEGGQNSLILAGRRPGTAGYSGAVHRSLQEESAEKRARRRETARKEERRAKGEGERERREKPGREKAAPRAGWAQAPRGSGYRESEEKAASVPRASPPAPRVPVPSLSRATGAVFVAGKEKQGWAGGEDAPPPLSGARAFLTRPRFRTLVPPRPDLAERL